MSRKSVASWVPPTSTDSDRRTLQGYQPLQRVAQSYLGPLWVARDPDAQSLVLLRRLSLPEGASEEVKLRIIEAARGGVTIEHPNVLEVLAALREDERIGFAYAHEEAEPLRSLQSWGNLRSLPFPVEVSLRVMVDLLSGVEAMHNQAKDPSMVFGGISPDSVLITRTGRTLLCDPVIAGCASMLESLGGNTAKLAYAAPEQIGAVSGLTAQTDVFACAVLLWELLAGRRLVGGSREAIELKLREHRLPKLSSALKSRQAITDALVHAVEAALSSDPNARPDNASELRRLLMRCGHPIATVEQVQQFVTKLSGQRFERRMAAVSSQSRPATRASSSPPLRQAPAQQGPPRQLSTKQTHQGMPVPPELLQPPGERPPTARPPALPDALPLPGVDAVAAPVITNKALDPDPDGTQNTLPSPARHGSAPRKPRPVPPGAASQELDAEEPAPISAVALPSSNPPSSETEERTPVGPPSLSVAQPVSLEPAAFSGPNARRPLISEPDGYLPDDEGSEQEDPTEVNLPPSAPEPPPMGAGPPPLQPAHGMNLPQRPPGQTQFGLGRAAGQWADQEEDPAPPAPPPPWMDEDRAPPAPPVPPEGPGSAPQQAPPFPLGGNLRRPAAPPPHPWMADDDEDRAPPAPPPPWMVDQENQPPSAPPPPHELPHVQPPGPPAMPLAGGRTALGGLAAAQHGAPVPGAARGMATAPVGTATPNTSPPPPLPPNLPTSPLPTEIAAPPPLGGSQLMVPRGEELPPLPAEKEFDAGVQRASSGSWSLRNSAVAGKPWTRPAGIALVGLSLVAVVAMLWPSGDSGGASEGKASAVAQTAEPDSTEANAEQPGPEEPSTEPPSSATEPGPNGVPGSPGAAAGSEAAGEDGPGPSASKEKPIRTVGAVPSAEDLKERRLSDEQLLALFSLEQPVDLSPCNDLLGEPPERRRATRTEQALNQLRAARQSLVEGDVDRAHHLLCEAERLDPHDAEIQRSLAKLALSIGDGASAKPHLEAALQVKKGNPGLLGLLGDAHGLEGELDEARAVWLSTLGAEPGNARASRRLAYSYAAQGRRALKRSAFSQARASFRRALILSNGSFSASAGMAEALTWLKEPAAALRWAQRAAQAYPKDAHRQMVLGDALHLNNQPEMALEAWKHSNQLRPSAIVRRRIDEGHP